MKQVAEEILIRIKEAKSIVITSHKSPDGDSVGSSLGMLRFIQKLNPSVIICHPDPMPDFLRWSLNEDQILTAENDYDKVREAMLGCDLLFALDYNGPSRMGEPMASWFDASTAKKAMIDHHLHPDDFVDYSISRPSVGSTSQLIYEFIEDLDLLNLLDASVATPLYLGIMTDTGSFRFSSVSQKTHQILGEMIAKGVDHTAIHEQTFDNNRIDKMRLRAHILSESLYVDEKHGVAIISVTNEDLERFHFIKGDTDGLVNEALSLKGIKAAVFFTEKEDGIKISFRSKGHVSVNTIAMEHFNGGGHMNASGGASDESLENTIERFKSLIPHYFEA